MQTIRNAQATSASTEGEIVVTARWREEALADVPVSASVIGGKAIATVASKAFRI